MAHQPYILSLDIGTGSVGYACMDKTFNILKYYDKDAIGVYLFDGAQTAQERRQFRTTRRRNNRRIKRLGLLQEILAPLVQNPNFYQFQRQFTWKNDNMDFKNKSLSEVLKFLGYAPKKYPTIYHLQKALLLEDRNFDPELIYMALYHLVKYRGHFLFNHLNIDNLNDNNSMDDFVELIALYESINHISLNLDYEKIKTIYEILQDNEMTKNDREKAIGKIEKALKHFSKMFLGLKFKEGDLFNQADNVEELKEANQTHSFADNYEENLTSFLTVEQLEFIENANKIYLSFTLQDILKWDKSANDSKDNKSMAISKVAAYDKFKNELNQVKDIVYKADPTKVQFKKIFVSSKESLKQYEEKPKKENLSKLCLFDQYLIRPKAQYKILIDELKKIIPQESPLYFEAENDTLLKVLNTTDNASIPMQINLYEAETILRNQQKYHAEITDEMIGKVLSLIQFRIPYYVGPLVNDQTTAKFGWMERKSNEPIKPWNFDEVVDRSKSATQFIRRMTNKCTYLMNEDVLPKNSLLYQEMEVLNELNSIQIRQQTDSKSRKYRLTPKIKLFAVEHIFKKYKTVSHRKFLEVMLNSNHRENFINHGEKLSIFGTQDDKKFVSKLSSYQDMTKIFGNIDDKRAQIEEIILWITIFEDKKILVQKLKENYPELTSQQINQLKKLNYSGWGRLSERLLTHNYHDHSIIDLLRNSDENFMEIITNDVYDFQSFIKEENQVRSNKIQYQDIADLATSPALKKGIWSTIKLVRELTSIFGEPEKIIMEFATEDQQKGKKQKSRKQLWDDNIKKNKLKSVDEYKHIIDVSNNLSNEQLQQEKLWLYFSQNGKCMYSGKSIDLDELLSPSSTKYYEVDHIIPRSFIKDDSIDNKVLVIKTMNQTKGDQVPLQFIQRPYERIAYWKSLNKAGLISDSKLHKLMKPEFTAMDKEGFIQRQLVETRQISVHVRDFLKEEYPNTKVIPMKAKMVSEFRKKFEIPKIRQMNDAHHAVDAYLNGVVYHGAQLAYPNVDLFDFNFKWEKVREKWKALGEFNTKQKTRELFFFKQLEKMEVSQGERLISKIKLDLNRFKINYSKKLANIPQQFYNQTALSPKTAELKYESDKSTDAVYTSLTTYQTFVVAIKTATKKGKVKMQYQIIDHYVFDFYKFTNGNEKELALYLARRENKDEVLDAQIVYKLNKGDLLYLNNHPCYFVSSKEVINAKQFELTVEEQLSLYKAMNNKETSVEKLIKTYDFIAEKVINEYRHYLDSELKEERVRTLFSESHQTHEGFIKAIDELFKVVTASAARSEKIGSRKSGMGNRAFLGKEKDVKISYKSISGLKTTKPKSLFKLAESRNEL
ncbi:type II CRISPR RNA-guided endonuclease Cas9 [Staphylococcus intermedius]|uniref:CRISPR-associated endonuclease Cas9 n=1 Tax=Staphylococcus intermedius NCTC 11048 TaxID=1141106 RepID=A0A380G4J1_STAIN|nr:type II CRISPR RNA-guided endonuclease Cas9 [Staphylococcus intermedius]PNZ50710.1 type II CRISPR RNA-guided endonuclease Cas9 [Staphylococcus intermedius NCTC 11048]SUM46054.1 CRISPR-associated protein, Csn1 family [Staphylococcus intermedius NCTC 11048]